MIRLCIELGSHRFRHQPGAVRLQPQPRRAVAVHGMQPAVEILRHRPVIMREHLQALPVIRHPPGESAGNDMLLEHIGTEHIHHLEENIPRFLIHIRLREHLPVGQAVGIGMVGFNILHRHRLPAPGMVDQDFPVNAEGSVKPFLVRLRPCGNISHREYPAILQTGRLAGPDLPEVRQRFVIPEQILVAGLIQFRYASSVFIRRSLLRHNVHRHFCQIQIGADADRGSNARLRQDSFDHRHGHEPCRLDAELCRSFGIGMEIRITVNKALINAVDMDVILTGIPEKDGINLCGHALVLRHPGHGNQVIQMLMVFRLPQLYRLLCLEKPRPARNPFRLQTR